MMENQELKQKIEALLFSSGKKMTLNEISVLTRAKPEMVQEALQELQQDYAAKESSLMIIQEGEFSKITVKEKHLELVRKIVAQTELSKTIMETLATVAWKAPCLQSEIIKIRTNKAYDHIKELEAEGFITRAKKGRTQQIRLSQKFYDYFDIPHEKVKELFSRFENLEKQIQQKEGEVEEAREKIKVIEEEHRKQKEAMETIDLQDLDKDEEHTHQETMAEELIQAEKKEEEKVIQEHPIEIASEKLGNLEVVDIEQPPEEGQEAQESPEQKEELTLEDAEERMQRDLPVPIKEKVNKRVKEIVPEADTLIEGESEESKENDDEEKTDISPDKEPDAEKDIEKKVDQRVKEMLQPEKDE